MVYASNIVRCVGVGGLRKNEKELTTLYPHLNGTLESPSLLILRVIITRFRNFFAIALIRAVDCTMSVLLPNWWHMRDHHNV